jgi:hypothetical protein
VEAGVFDDLLAGGPMHDELPRKPLIYLLVILPILVGGGVSLVIALVAAFSAIRGVPRSAVPNVNGMLIGLPAFFLWIPASLLLGNVVLYAVPPLRRIAESYATRAHQPGFVESQKILLKIAGYFALICIPLIVLGYII